MKALFGAKGFFGSVDARLHAQEINTGLCDEVDASRRSRRAGADDEYRVGGPADGEVGERSGVRGGSHPLGPGSVGGATDDVAHEVYQYGRVADEGCRLSDQLSIGMGCRTN
ncbi:hypothetical protein [Streptomyces sp. CBMA156]|uniref:hypothetical protein n=1 Tax=Streptomyces sp. CBMA156 TaxID=1930280 RepID=UPI001CB7D368|nr:hypothetical protein [Streptomyces sp. CBMA156]